MEVQTVSAAKRALLILAMVFVALALALPNVACGRKSSWPTDDFGNYQWPQTTLASLIPEPESKYGSIQHESSDSLWVYVGRTSKSQYDAYVEECMGMGFTVDYSKRDTYFSAENAEGYTLSVDYRKDGQYMSIDLDAPQDEPAASGEAVVEPEPAEPPASVDSAPSPEPSASGSEPTPVSPQPADGIRPEFKETMDGYEAFFDEYCTFAKEYASGDKASMVAQYGKMTARYYDISKKLDDLDVSQMSSEEEAYYYEVMERINQKLLEANASLAGA